MRSPSARVPATAMVIALTFAPLVAGPQAVAASGAAYRLDLYRTGDFVGQADPKWCIGRACR